MDVAPTLVTGVFDAKAPLEAYTNGRSLFDASDRPFVLVGNWDSFAMVENDRVDVSETSGDMTFYDANYRPIKGPPPKSESLIAALKEISQFYAR